VNDVLGIILKLLSHLCDNEGYWRKQMEHICGHLKAHAGESVNFRAVVAQPRLGKVREIPILSFSLIMMMMMMMLMTMLLGLS